MCLTCLCCRRYLQELAEREVVRAAASGNMWYCASHPEHVRPMLQVCLPTLPSCNVASAYTYRQMRSLCWPGLLDSHCRSHKQSAQEVLPVSTAVSQHWAGETCTCERILTGILLLRALRRLASQCCCRPCQLLSPVRLMQPQLRGCWQACCSSQSCAGCWAWTGSVRQQWECWQHAAASSTLLPQVPGLFVHDSTWLDAG